MQYQNTKENRDRIREREIVVKIIILRTYFRFVFSSFFRMLCGKWEFVAASTVISKEQYFTVSGKGERKQKIFTFFGVLRHLHFYGARMHYHTTASDNIKA